MTDVAAISVPATKACTAPTLSIIVPTYRDGSRIFGNLVRLDRALSVIGEPYEIIVVSDGNVDDTPNEARRMNAPHVHVHHYAQNMGKGFALRYGFARSSGEVVTFIDGDGDIDPEQISTYLRIMRETGADIVIGSKRHPDSQVVYPPLRRLYSATYQALLRRLFRLQVRDTQVGLKQFRRDVLSVVLPRIVVKRYAFDLELLVVAHHLGFTHIVEAPVRIGQRFSTTINTRAIASILLETAAIFYRKKVLRYYDQRHSEVPESTLSAKIDSELMSSSGEARMIARNVVLWLAQGPRRCITGCYTRLRATIRNESGSSLDKSDEGSGDHWRAAI